MRQRMIRLFLAGAVAVSMVAWTPALTFAQQTELSGMAGTEEVKGGKPDGMPKEPKAPKANGKAQEVGKIVCTSAGKLNISFKQNVSYTDGLMATITDTSGMEISCKILKKNKKLLSVSASGLAEGQTYTLTITGVVGAGTSEAVVISKEFIAKGMKIKGSAGSACVEGKKFVVLKMNGAVLYQDATVTVTDSKGNACDAKIVKKSGGTVKIQINGMKKGETYTVTVYGIRAKKDKNFGSITKTVTVK